MEIKIQTIPDAAETKCVVEIPTGFPTDETFGVVKAILDRYGEADKVHRTTVLLMTDQATDNLKTLVFSRNQSGIANAVVSLMVDFKPFAEAVLAAAERYKENNDL